MLACKGLTKNSEICQNKAWMVTIAFFPHVFFRGGRSAALEPLDKRPHGFQVYPCPRNNGYLRAETVDDA